MDRQYYEVKTKIIQEIFNDKRKLNPVENKDELNLDDHVYQEGDIFLCDNGEFVVLDFQIKDFNEDELVKYAELAENLYEINEKPVSIYLVCREDIDVCVKECEIKSEADFKIKLACTPKDQCKEDLNRIKRKLKRNEILSGDDLHILSSLQVRCKKEDRNYYRKEYLKIINRLHY